MAYKQIKRAIMFLLVATLILSLSVPVLGAGADGPVSPPGLERATQVKEQHANALLAIPGVVGAAVGVGDRGRAAVIVFIERPGVGGVPASLDGVPVAVRVSGKFVALAPPDTAKGKGGNNEPTLPPTARWPRPVPIGVSTGHPSITAGTIGARVKDALGNVYALSNNHVYADENRAILGDGVIQPGTYDGGTAPDDVVGTLYDYEPIVFGGASNIVDAAIALSSTAVLGNATPSNGYGTPRSTTAAATLNLKVKKYGRTTGFTKGQVYAINATVDVGYDSGVARFDNQIVVTPGTFSAGGDSGSLVVADGKGRSAGEDRKPVGLLFAGSSLYTLANPIDAVLSRYGVTIDGE